MYVHDEGTERKRAGKEIEWKQAEAFSKILSLKNCERLVKTLNQFADTLI